ncbi:MAG TPA: excinuclease ATPase subunit [Burkholderiaceae bacterium]|nr:excinuclease ATPase subunit [Burkholderiaceae bacterium]
MNKLMISAILSGAALMAALPAQASDTVLMMPIAGAMAVNDAQARLGDSVKFYFGDQQTPRVQSKIGSDKTSQRTNGFGKSAEKSCNWVFLSAMLALQKHAQEVGADAVINIVSNYKDKEVSSQTQFECHDGAIMSGVALKGDFVKLAK